MWLKPGSSGLWLMTAEYSPRNSYLVPMSHLAMSHKTSFMTCNSWRLDAHN